MEGLNRTPSISAMTPKTAKTRPAIRAKRCSRVRSSSGVRQEVDVFVAGDKVFTRVVRAGKCQVAVAKAMRSTGLSGCQDYPTSSPVFLVRPPDQQVAYAWDRRGG